MLMNTPVCDFGWKAPEFSLPDAHQTLHNMKDYLGSSGLLIAFLCNHCPYVKAIGTRLATDTRDLQKNGVNTVAIMSNDYSDYPEDSPENMIKFADHYGWNFPYLLDHSQEVGKAYGAICTPDFFGLNSAGELQYRGRLDDARLDDAPNRSRELYDAMIQIAKTAQGPREQTPSMGCSIKWR